MAKKSLKRPAPRKTSPRKPAPEVRRTAPPLEFARSLRSFIGFLEGTGKSLHTIKNYRLDLLAFERFLASENLLGKVSLERVTRDEIERFHDQLKAEGLKTNTRRRKLLTVRQFLAYLTRRKKLPEDLNRKLPAPEKIERIPFAVPLPRLIDAIRKLPVVTALDARNRVLLWTLAETGCLVSELPRVRFDHWLAPSGERTAPALRIEGANARLVPISAELLGAVEQLKPFAKASQPHLFLGFNKFGPMGAPITPRGVELLVRSMGVRLGFPELTPRTFRHSAAIHWFELERPRDEIRARLGLRTDYAFRTYEVLFRALKAAKSVSV